MEEADGEGLDARRPDLFEDLPDLQGVRRLLCLAAA